MSKVLKTLVAFSAVALVLGVAVAPAPAAAQTTAELQALIASLQSQIAALTAQLGGGSAAVSTTFTRDLTLGSTGEDVKALQVFLNSKGYTVATTGAGAPGMESTYFGTRTQAALAAYQAANGIAPAAGYFGPKTRAAVSAAGGSTTGGSTTGGTTGGSTSLSGGAGSINDVDYVSGINNEEVGEGEEDQEVAGIRIEADDGSDIEILAVNLNFSKGSGATHDFRKYADEVSIWLDGEELARLDGDEFTDDNSYDKTVTLDAGGIIDAGEKGDLVVKVSGVSNLDSADEGDTWSLEFESVRFRDGSGAIIADSSTGDINDGTGRNFTFDSFATAADVELKAQKSNDSPDSQVINVDDTNDTDGVELLVFTLEAKGSDIEIKDLPITFATSTATAETLSEITSAVYLEIDGTMFSELSSAAVHSGGAATVTFDNIDMTISKGDKVTVRVLADINDTQAGEFVDGDTLTASYTASNRAMADIEDETGEDLPAADRTGTALGDALAFYDVGIMVSNFQTDATAQVGTSANDDTGVFHISFDVTAFDGTIYVSTSTSATTQTTAPAVTTDNTYIITLGGTATTTLLSDSLSYTTGDGASLSSTAGNIELADGESTKVTMTVSRTNTGPTNAGLYQVLLKGIGWSTSDVGSGYNNYRFDLDDVKTSSISLN